MSISLIVSGLGAVVAAIGSGVLLARCFRAPRGDLIFWSLALLGLLISLGAQTLGRLTGFDPAMFRAMEIGAEVIAPLALILALSEVAATSAPVRFCARLYIPALAIVAVVVLLLDQLTDTAFTKAWPDPSVYYQIAPEYVLYALGAVVAVLALVAMSVVARRAGSRPGWSAVLPAQLAGGVAALLLAYPALALLAAHEEKVHLPVSSLFAVLCAAAAALTWLAGTLTGRVRLAELQGRAGRAGRLDEAGGFEPVAEPGRYRDAGLYREDRGGLNGQGRYHDDAGPGWPDDRAARDWDDDWRDDNQAGQRGGWRDDDARNSEADWRGGGDERGARDWHDDDRGYDADYATGDFATGDFATGDFVTGGFVPGDLDAVDRDAIGRDAIGRDAIGRDAIGRDAIGRDAGGRGPDERADPLGRAAGDGQRTQLFGQIAIYTLLEDRVDEFDQLAEQIVDQVRSREPDALVYIVHAVPSAPMQRILYEVYRDRAAYDRHVHQPHVVRFETERRPYVLATNVIELGLQQGKVSPFPFQPVTDLFPEPGYDTAGFERPDYLRDYGRAPSRDGQRERR